MTAVLLMSAAAAIGVGYLGAIAEVAVRKLHGVPVVRKTVEVVFLFSLVDSAARWTNGWDSQTVRGMFARWSSILAEIRRWLIIGSVVAAAAIAIISWAYLAAFGAVTKNLLWLIVVAVVLAGLWLARRRS